jgi:cysteinyl-tRNA synthetase
MYIYNSLSNQKEDLDKALGGSKKIRLFVCGPTVYDYPHIGNARTYITFDIIVKYLRDRGYKVFYLQNITDIDDKIIKRAQEENTTWKSVAKKFERIYHADEKALGIDSVNRHARATDYIKSIVGQVQTLVDKGFAYFIENDGWYFDVSKFPDYGKLARRTTLQAEDAVSRIDESVHKRNKGDFALWKMSKPGEPSWKTPLGAGRPGWHIEDTAITEKHFGPQYDLHGGAVDLKFPHHEAEIAQQESASGKKPFVKIWLHTGFLLVNGQKMSKSLGNFISIRDFLAKYSPSVLRYIVVSHHYQSPIDYNDKLAADASKALDSITQTLAKIALASGNLNVEIFKYDKLFDEKMQDDFNTPRALAAIFELINEINPKIWELSKKSAREIATWLKEKLKILGIEVKYPKIPLKIKLLARKRELFRSSKQFVQSDALRKQMEELGYTIEDTPAGPFLWPANPKF